ncbi:sulfotransferase [Nocardiopsis lambiniae]|uniref:Sulfotransferase n=1 Tax=Nocardiopsis lambiniae TaxID=3075539 RepID=A0ABU2MAB8_9ACTN|nr:sulfotransferase [Nocardiopsis sp. DSM 44743]MDT0329105.1 sulfotransferase [Nocardiopsis sp. DSM 44743]
MGRSGSTLIERLLGELPGFCSIGETVHLWRRGLLENERCGCGLPFADCGFWAEVGREAFGGWGRLNPHEVLGLKDGVDRTRFLPVLLNGSEDGLLAARSARYTELYHRLYSAIALVSGASVIVDASKHASLAACLRWRYGARMRLLHVVRDPRAVAHSWSKRVPRPDASPESSEPEMARYSAGRSAVQWVTQNTCFDALARQGVPTLRVRYEDFVGAPTEEFARIAGFAGHTGSCPDLGDGVSLSRGHALSGNPMRFSSGPVGVHADQGWREALPPWRRRLVAMMTTPARRRYGY